MRIFRNIFSQMHRWVLWALLSAIFWGWIFTLLTDAPPARKVVLYAQVESCRSEELALRLEEDKPEGIKLIQAQPFSYALFGNGLLEGDLYVVRASDMETFLPDFAPLEDEDFDCGERELYRQDGHVYGVKIYDAASKTGAAAEYLDYDPQEDFYLCMRADSLHLGGGDGAALRIAEALLKLK